MFSQSNKRSTVHTFIFIVFAVGIAYFLRVQIENTVERITGLAESPLYLGTKTPLERIPLLEAAERQFDVASWNTVRSDALGFTISYPPDFQLVKDTFFYPNNPTFGRGLIFQHVISTPSKDITDIEMGIGAQDNSSIAKLIDEKVRVLALTSSRPQPLSLKGQKGYIIETAGRRSRGWIAVIEKDSGHSFVMLITVLTGTYDDGKIRVPFTDQKIGPDHVDNILGQMLLSFKRIEQL